MARKEYTPEQVNGMLRGTEVRSARVRRSAKSVAVLGFRSNGHR
jgi:hypothetical protein